MIVKLIKYGATFGAGFFVGAAMNKAVYDEMTAQEKDEIIVSGHWGFVASDLISKHIRERSDEMDMRKREEFIALREKIERATDDIGPDETTSLQVTNKEKQMVVEAALRPRGLR